MSQLIDTQVIGAMNYKPARGPLTKLFWEHVAAKFDETMRDGGWALHGSRSYLQADRFVVEAGCETDDEGGNMDVDQIEDDSEIEYGGEGDNGVDGEESDTDDEVEDKDENQEEVEDGCRDSPIDVERAAKRFKPGEGISWAGVGSVQDPIRVRGL